VCYRGKKNAWVTRDLFLDCFNSEFVPSVRRHLSSVNFPMEAVLLLDNYSGHPSADELRSEDGKVFAMFLPPNTTTYYDSTNRSECYPKHKIELPKNFTYEYFGG